MLKQILGTTDPRVFGSWGVSSRTAVQMVVEGSLGTYPMAGLALQVNGFLYKGRVVVLLDEAVDYYMVLAYRDGERYTVYKDISFDQLGELLDIFIERGTMSDKEYWEKIVEEYPG